jgi:hypothetical protein
MFVTCFDVHVPFNSLFHPPCLTPPIPQILKASISPKDDIIAERRRATFDALKLCYALNGGKEKIERR